MRAARWLPELPCPLAPPRPSRPAGRWRRFVFPRFASWTSRPGRVLGLRRIAVMGADVLAGLIAELPEGMVVSDPAVTESYRQDRALDPSAGKPMAVVRPRRTEEVQTILRWASAHHVPVVTRGMGPGVSGGATAVDGGIVLSTEKMRDITVDPVTRTAVCQPGLLNAEVKKTVAEHG